MRPAPDARDTAAHTWLCERNTGLRRLSGAAVALLAILLIQDPVEAMSPYLWKMRPLVIFAPSDRAPDFVRQMGIVAANRQGFAERDMAVVTIAGDTVAAPLGPGPGVTAEALRGRYGVARNAFRVLLIGKDGGVKLSSDQAVGAGRLFALIDSMPMRRQEMREKGR